MLYLDFEGKTEKEAVQVALDTLGLEMEDVKVEVLEKGSAGLLGIGKKVNAKVRIYYQEKNDVIELMDRIKNIIEKIDEGVYFDVSHAEDKRYVVNVDSANPGALIGKNGQNLKALQDIVNAICKKYKNKYKIVIDVNHYHKKQDRRLISEAREMAKKVQETGEEQSLGLMNPFHRRLIHMEIKKMKGVSTYSKGEGVRKEIFIIKEQ